MLQRPSKPEKWQKPAGRGSVVEGFPAFGPLAAGSYFILRTFVFHHLLEGPPTLKGPDTSRTLTPLWLLVKRVREPTGPPASRRGKWLWSKQPGDKSHVPAFKNTTNHLQEKQDGSNFHLPGGSHAFPNTEVAKDPGEEETQDQLPPQAANLLNAIRDAQHASPGKSHTTHWLHLHIDPTGSEKTSKLSAEKI